MHISLQLKSDNLVEDVGLYFDVLVIAITDITSVLKF